MTVLIFHAALAVRGQVRSHRQKIIRYMITTYVFYTFFIHTKHRRDLLMTRTEHEGEIRWLSTLRLIIFILPMQYFLSILVLLTPYIHCYLSYALPVLVRYDTGKKINTKRKLRNVAVSRHLCMLSYGYARALHVVLYGRPIVNNRHVLIRMRK